jgi:hypothetical protein
VSFSLTRPCEGNRFSNDRMVNRNIVIKNNLERGQEGSERVAAGYAPTVLAADVLAIRTGGVLAPIPTNKIVALVQVKNNPDHCVTQRRVRSTGL